MIRALGAKKRVLSLVCVPYKALPLPPALWRGRCPLWSLEIKTVVPGSFQGRGPFKKILQKNAFECTLEMKLGAHIPGFPLVADLPRLARDIHQYTR